MWKEYLKFTRGERIAIISLVVFIIILLVLPSVVSFESPPTLQEIGLLSNTEATRPDSGGREIPGNGQYSPGTQNTEAAESRSAPRKISMFYFDPNKLSEQGWMKLGVSEKAARTIQNYLGKGGRFRTPEDIRKIYSLREEEKVRLLPFVRIEEAIQKKSYSAPALIRPVSYPGSSEKKENFGSARKFAAHESGKPVILDINQADSVQWLSLPGIGSRLAGRILHFREALGGFCQVRQVSEIYGLADSVFQNISPQLRCAIPTIRKLAINMADKQQLSLHPYIRYRRADAILRFRQQHGSFSSLKELQSLTLWTEEEWTKLEPYLTL